MLRAFLLVSLISASHLSLGQQSGTSTPGVPARVYVYDQVSGPMTVAIGNNGLTVLQALATTEGMDWSARLRYAEIIRKAENGHSDILLDVQGIIQEKAPDVKLQANDILFISSGKPLEEQLAKSGRPVPEVNADDIKTVWKLYDEANANNADQELGPDIRVLLATCKPGTDVIAVSERVAVLRLFLHLQKDPETQSLPGKKIEVNDAAFQVLAKIPIHLQPGDDNGFDVEEFLRRIREAE